MKITRPGTGSARGIAAGFLGLVALHALGSRGGSGRVAEAFADVAGVIERVLDPNVPAIPDRRAAAGPAARVAAARAAGGVQQTTTGRFAGRLPLSDPPK